MHLKVCKFGCDRSVIYVSLFEEPCALSAVYRVVLEGFYLIFPHRISQSFAIIAVCLVSMCQQFTALYLKSFLYMRPYLGFRWRSFPENSYLIFQTQTLQNYQVINVVNIYRWVGLYLHFLGEKMVIPCMIRRADSRNLNKHSHGVMKSVDMA